MSTPMIVGIIFLVAGFILVGIEIYIPGFGISGIAGIICLCAGVVLTAETIEQGIMITIIVIAALAVMVTVLILIMNSHKTKLPIVLMDEVKKNSEYIGEDDLKFLIHKEGVAITDLRPFGKGHFDGVELSVKSVDGKFIKHDSDITIIGIKDNTLLVSSK